MQHCAGFISAGSLSDPAEIKPAQCCINLVFHLTYFSRISRLTYNIHGTQYVTPHNNSCKIFKSFVSAVCYGFSFTFHFRVFGIFGDRRQGILEVACLVKDCFTLFTLHSPLVPKRGFEGKQGTLSLNCCHRSDEATNAVQVYGLFREVTQCQNNTAQCQRNLWQPSGEEKFFESVWKICDCTPFT